MRAFPDRRSPAGRRNPARPLGVAAALPAALRGALAALATVLAIAALALLVGCASASIGGDDIDAESIADTQAASGSQADGTGSGEGASSPEGSYSGYTVVIDAGHQAHGNSSQEPVGPGASETKAKVSSGTSGRTSGVAEYEVNLQVALKLRDWLASSSVDVVMVRESNDVDISNSERADVANDNGAALFVRLHCDGSENSSSHGFSTLVPASNQWTSGIYSESARAGQIVQAAAVQATGAKDNGVVERSDLSGFNWCEVPTVLCEMGFMTNPDEDGLLTSDWYQQKLAEGIGQGVLGYLDTL